MRNKINKSSIVYISCSVLLVFLFVSNIIFGSVSISLKDIIDVLTGNDTDPKIRFIILSSRLPQAITALLAGAALSISGLLLQTLFRNPLASPSILGISSGAGLGVAFVTLFMGSYLSGILSGIAIVSGALIGATVVLVIILLVSTIVRNNVMLLIVGMMVSYLATSAVSLLSFYSSAEGIASYVMWGMGNFSSVTGNDMPLFAILIISGLIVSILLIKPLDTLLLGERYAENLGVNIVSVRIASLCVTGLLAAVVTAYCGPISFIGLAVPHIARMGSGSSSHVKLIPMSILLGGVISLSCNLLTVVSGDGTIIPINVITPLMGAPVILYVILNKNKSSYFRSN